MLDCIAGDFPRPAIVADGDNYMLVLPREYEHLAGQIAKLISAIPTSANDRGEAKGAA